jgi:hypothetical protein
VPHFIVFEDAVGGIMAHGQVGRSPGSGSGSPVVQPTFSSNSPRS